MTPLDEGSKREHLVVTLGLVAAKSCNGIQPMLIAPRIMSVKTDRNWAEIEFQPEFNGDLQERSLATPNSA
jgi:hypothetical protein